MTKKDYIIIANAIKSVGIADSHERNYKDQLVEKFCYLFLRDNPRFDKQRFLDYLASDKIFKMRLKN